MNEVREIRIDDRPIYFLADDLGQIWHGGWYSRDIAIRAAEDQIERDWDGEGLPPVDVKLIKDDGTIAL